MTGNVYISILILLMTLNIFLYRKDLGALLPGEKIRQKKQEIKEEILFMTVKNKKNRLERELFRSIVTLKNLSLVRRETPLSADYIYEKLTENGGRLRPLYSRMLTLYRSGCDNEAFSLFASEIGTKQAKSFAYILSKLDKLNPAQLAEQMEIFQENMAEAAMTAALKRAQRNSVIITGCAALSIFAMLINFTVVVIFMDTMEVLNGIFF